MDRSFPLTGRRGIGDKQRVAGAGSPTSPSTAQPHADKGCATASRRQTHAKPASLRSLEHITPLSPLSAEITRDISFVCYKYDTQHIGQAALVQEHTAQEHRNPSG